MRVYLRIFQHEEAEGDGKGGVGGEGGGRQRECGNFAYPKSIRR